MQNQTAMSMQLRLKQEKKMLQETIYRDLALTPSNYLKKGNYLTAFGKITKPPLRYFFLYYPIILSVIH